MKRLIIVVEGQTEEEFVKSVIAPYLDKFNINDVTPIIIATSAKSKGGFVNYQHLKKNVLKRIHENNVIVSMFADYFRIPTNIPNYDVCITQTNTDDKILCLEEAIGGDIGFSNFIPYIQKHEFESLLFSANKGFEEFYEESIYTKTQQVVSEFDNPEDINSHSTTAPSKRLISIIGSYEKVVEGNLIALEIGIEQMLKKCLRFKNWIETLIAKVSETA